MKVWEITIKIYVLKDIRLNCCQEQVVNLVDRALFESEKFKKLHKTNIVKPYVVSNIQNNNLTDIRKVTAGSLVTFKVRTISEELKEYLMKYIPKQENEFFKGIVADNILIPKRNITRLNTLTLVNTTFLDGDKPFYWRDLGISIEEFKVTTINNLINKYFKIMGVDIGKITIDTIDAIVEDFWIDDRPYYIKYKGVKLKGDKISIKFTDNPIAQELAYFSLGVGVSNKSTRGFGFVNNPSDGRRRYASANITNI